MFNVNSQDVRRFFAEVWRHRFDMQLEPIQQMALKIILAHPEYQPYLEKVEDYIDFVWSPELGETNPFLHLSLHLSIQEQVSIDQPPGIAAIHQKLCAQEGDWVSAEDKMMDALVEMIWKAQRSGTGFDVNEYITHLRRLVGLGAEDNPRLNPHEIK
ncbi:DUF1841 family protein [Neisseriaceae bacterium PsAf]|nr:DUF1841 family protein [Neisseriaceae bacterium PsAf]MCV2503076.1 DUF1841 family protein [Neisseriaceae bacterium]